MRLAAEHHRAPPARRRAPRASTSHPARRSSSPRAAASAVKFAIVAPVQKPTPASAGSPSRSSTQRRRHLLDRRRRRRRIGEARHLPPGRASQSAATPAGCDAPITQPWKCGLVIPSSPPSAFAASSSTTATGGGPCLRHRSGEAAPASRHSSAPPPPAGSPTPRRYALACAAAASKAAASASPNPCSDPGRDVRSDRARSAAAQFSSFHAASALCGAGNAGRGTNLPRPGCGWLLRPSAQTTSPRRERVARLRRHLEPLEHVVVDDRLLRRSPRSSCASFGSQTTMSASAPSTIAPFFG